MAQGQVKHHARDRVKRDEEVEVYDGGLNVLDRLIERDGIHRSELIESKYWRMTACCSGRWKYDIRRSDAKFDLEKL